MLIANSELDSRKNQRESVASPRSEVCGYALNNEDMPLAESRRDWQGAVIMACQ